jgi:nicotinamide mononucleotide adenylyltransferase
MQFDTKSPVPKVMFSPVSAIDDDMLSIIDAQAKSSAAESAVKLTVYQADESESTEIPEPVLRKSDKVETGQPADVSDVIKKWSKKK